MGNLRERIDSEKLVPYEKSIEVKKSYHSNAFVNEEMRRGIDFADDDFNQIIEILKIFVTQYPRESHDFISNEGDNLKEVYARAPNLRCFVSLDSSENESIREASLYLRIMDKDLKKVSP